LINDRPYRPALPLSEALRRLKEAAGSQFDPHLARLFARAVTHRAVVIAPAKPPQRRRQRGSGARGKTA
jgi:HD-GYP domain-containing protein (c-di-GMP phosphodiesterase class II)